MTKKYIVIILILCSIFSTSIVFAKEKDNRETVYYFFENVCGSCIPEQDFYDEFLSITGRPLSEYIYIYKNVYHESGRKFFDEVMSELGIEENNQLLPMVIIGQQVYPGTTAIYEKLAYDFIPKEAGEMDSMIYSLYVPSCEGCAAIKKLLEEIGDTITVKRGDVFFESKLIINEIDMTQNAGLAYQLFEKYNVPESKQIAPIVFIGNNFLSGSEYISSNLKYMLGQGMGLNTTPLDVNNDTPLPTITFFGTLIAGFIGGLNPCSLSMLLFFLSLLMTGNSKIWRLVLPFVFGKLIAYLLIGTVFLEVLRVWNPSWLPLVSRILMTVIGFVLAVLNIHDFVAAKSEKYGKIVNQLPVGLRKFNHNLIRNAIDKKSRILPISLIVLGVFVALGEFICTGQLYLGTILTMLHQNIATFQVAGLFFTYSIAFVLPPLILTFVIAKGRELFDVSEYVRRMMPTIKLITAIVFMSMVLLAWIM